MPRTPSLVSIALALALLPGCYLLHEADHDDVIAPSPSTPGVPDASAPRPADASAPAPMDARPPTPPPLPPEPEPDLGPDARPSDYPDADEWEEVPAIAEDEDCCELDEPIAVAWRDARSGGILRPLIAWGQGRWGLLLYGLWTSEARAERVAVLELATDGAPLGPPREIGPEPAVGQAIEWAEGRWAIAVQSLDGAGHRTLVRHYDRDFRAAGEWLSIGWNSPFELDLVRLTAGDTWLAVGNVVDTSTLAVTPFREDAIEPTMSYPSGRLTTTLGAVGLRSRAAVLMGDLFGEPNHMVVLGPGPAHDIVGRIPLATHYRPTQAAVTALRDLAVVAGVQQAESGQPGEAWIEVVDPFAATTIGGPRSLGPALAAQAGAIDVVGSAKHGLAGVCYARAADPWNPTPIEFRLIGPDGVFRGRPVRIATVTWRGQSFLNCAVGTDDAGFLVAWWHETTLWVRRVRVPPI